jgi:mannobiose 2-epimerase
MNKKRLRELSNELEKELEGNILPWWMKHSPDREYGGFHGHIAHDNQVVTGAGKGAVMHARILWTFSAACRMYRKPEYLETAHRAYHYMMDHFMDREFGGVCWELDGQGRVRNSRKQIYAIAFTIYALAEYRMACGDEKALHAAIDLFSLIESNALDRERNGYTDALSREWEPVVDLRLSEKDPNESKTMNTHLHILEAYANLCRVWKDPALDHALQNIIGLFIYRFVDQDNYQLNLFFDDDWNLRSSLVSFGHNIECAWLLHEAAEVLGDRGLKEKTGRLAVEMARKNFSGLDADGGLYYELFPDENRLDTDKHWWPQAEAMVGHFNAFQLSGEELFALQALKSWEFIKNRIIDREFGEWYWSVNREGVPQKEKEKAGFWKCPYHNGRACMEMIRRIDETIKMNEI